jgi:hypothetical protein
VPDSTAPASLLVSERFPLPPRSDSLRAFCLIPILFTVFALLASGIAAQEPVDWEMVSKMREVGLENVVLERKDRGECHREGSTPPSPQHSPMVTDAERAVTDLP